MDNKPQFKSLLNQLQTAVFVVNDELQICEVNVAAEDLIEIGKKQLIGSDFQRIFSESEYPSQVLDISLTTGKSYYQRDVVTVLLSGRKTILDFAINRFMHENRHFLLVEISQSIGSAIFTVKQKDLGQHRQTRHLLKDLAHEIRNPLGGLRGAAQLLSEEIAISQKPFTDIIIREADRLSELVERVLGAGKPEIKSEFNIHEVIEEVLILINLDLPDNITIIRDYDPSLPTYKGYRQSLYQVILNLVRNAVQAIQSEPSAGFAEPSAGNIEPSAEDNEPSAGNRNHHICISTRAEHAVLIGNNYFPLALKINISDDGPGIPENIKEQLFMPMVSGQKQGSGLGLAIAREAVEQHGGSLQWLENEAETVFCIHLPQL